MNYNRFWKKLSLVLVFALVFGTVGHIAASDAYAATGDVTLNFKLDGQPYTDKIFTDMRITTGYYETGVTPSSMSSAKAVFSNVTVNESLRYYLYDKVYSGDGYGYDSEITQIPISFSSGPAFNFDVEYYSINFEVEYGPGVNDVYPLLYAVYDYGTYDATDKVIKGIVSKDISSIITLGSISDSLSRTDYLDKTGDYTYADYVSIADYSIYNIIWTGTYDGDVIDSTQGLGMNDPFNFGGKYAITPNTINYNRLSLYHTAPLEIKCTITLKDGCSEPTYSGGGSSTPGDSSNGSDSSTPGDSSNSSNSSTPGDSSNNNSSTGGGSSSSNSSSSGGSSTSGGSAPVSAVAAAAAPAPALVVVIPTTTTAGSEATAEVSVGITSTVSNSGNLNVTVSNKLVSDILSAVKKEAKKTKSKVEDLQITIDVTAEGNIKNMNTKLDKSTVKTLSNAEATLTVASPAYQVSLDKTALGELTESLKGTLSILAKPVKPSKAIKNIIGDHPVFEFTMKDSRGKKITELESGTVAYSVPYTLAAGESADGLYIIKIVNGKPVRLEAVYEDGWLSWSDAPSGVFAVAFDASVHKEAE